MSLIVDVLESAGVTIRYGNGAEITVCCPFCTERGERLDTRYRLGINTQTGAAHDFNCHWKGRGVAYVAKELCRAYGIPFRVNPRARLQESALEPAKPKEEPPASLCLPEGYESFRGADDAIGLKARKYLTETRGVSTLQIVKHKIGYAVVGPLAWRILFPVLDDKGRVAGCVGRDFSGQQKPKYMNTVGTKFMWGAHQQANTAIVVEGPLDALRVEQALLQSRNTVAVARLGSTVTPEQLIQLRKYEKLIVLPDHDRAGVYGAIDVCRVFEKAGLATFVSVPSNMSGLDPGGMTTDQITECIGSAMAWSDATARRLQLSASREGR